MKSVLTSAPQSELTLRLKKTFRKLKGAVAIVATLASGCRYVPPFARGARMRDAALQALTEELRRAQPALFGLPENSTYNYVWAQYVMAFI